MTNICPVGLSNSKKKVENITMRNVKIMPDSLLYCRFIQRKTKKWNIDITTVENEVNLIKFQFSCDSIYVI